ncbi:hypothetical protein F3J29_05205 [Enterobacter sp. Cy-643]|uniref:hypothetical protein n=1 Tax=Enterobacter sp. Cy-643 TaxID=2608346 RepID=UPI00141FBBC3|nr:hypothetical protein [Enterobacter sp. Cy-643]NIF31532.1 hypothetical protein [Enterobacter sp. Cy-643]
MPDTTLFTQISRAITCFAFVLFSLTLGLPQAFAQALPRIVVPIHAKLMANDGLRYSVTLTIGGKPVETMLDTGSVGLRVMPGVLNVDNVERLNKPEHVQYSSGVQLDGELVRTQVGFEGVNIPTVIQLVESAQCNAIRPHCIASKAPIDQFRMGGDPVSAGYKAILGIGMTRNNAPNPLLALGERWIVILPRPHDSEPGKLIINPLNAETSGFRQIALSAQPPKPGDTHHYWKDSEIDGCLERLDTGEKVCGKNIIDSGSEGFIYFSADPQAQDKWPDGTPVHYTLTLADGRQFGQRFKVAKDGGRYIHHIVNLTKHSLNTINGGIITYFDNSVLYDQTAGTIGLKARH